MLRRLVASFTAVLALALSSAPAPAVAQAIPYSFQTQSGSVPASELDTNFSYLLTYAGTMVPKAGGTMTGALVLPASSNILTPLVIPQGSAPSSPVNGAAWTTSAGMYIRIGGVTYGPLVSSILCNGGLTGGTVGQGQACSLGSPTAHGLLIGEGSGAIAATSAPTSGQIVVGQASGDPAVETVGGDGALAANGTLTVTKTGGVSFGTFATANAATPPAIGGTTPNTGKFSTLQDTGVSGSTQCMQADSAGNLTGTGSPCGTGAGTVATSGSPASGNLTKFTGASTISNGDLTGDVTTSGTLATTLATVNSGPGACGDATHVCQVTTNGKGLVTTQTAVAISGLTPSTCSNPCTIGSVSIRSGSGVPSAADPQGSLFIRTDIPSVYQIQQTASTFPAWVQGASVNGGTVTVAAPAGGDYLVAACDGGATIPTASSGWTLISSQAVGSWGPAIAVVYHYFAATGSTSQTPCTGSVITTSILEVSGLDPSNFNTNYVSTTWAQNGGASSVAVSVNTTADNTLALAIGGSSGASGSFPTLSFNSSYVNLTQANTAAGQSHSIGMATKSISTSGSAAGQTLSTSPADFGVTNAVLLLKPTASGPSFGWQQMVAIPQPTTSYTVSTLPLQASNGSRAVVTDANAACTFNSSPTGGGSTVCTVWWNGTAWVEG